MMDSYYLFGVFFILLGSTINIYTTVRRYYLTQQIKKSGRLITMTPLLSALIASRQTDSRRMWMSPATGLPPPPSYSTTYTPQPPPSYHTANESLRNSPPPTYRP